MYIGVVSDTHGEVLETRRAIRVLEIFGVDMIIHCGDIGQKVVGEFKSRPTHFVCGNTDNSLTLNAVVRSPQQTFHDRFGSLEVEGRSIAFLHGDDAILLHETINSGRWDIVCFGHTHSSSKAYQGRTLVINPGAIYRSSYPSVAVVEIPSLEVTFIPLG
jgi:uncharacterized protein